VAGRLAIGVADPLQCGLVGVILVGALGYAIGRMDRQ
jgi:hypothetical protein